MFNLNNNNTWQDNVQGYDTTDPVLGGTTGQSNEPVQQLADRTFYLYDRLGRYLQVLPISLGVNSTVSFSAASKGQLIYVNAAGNGTIQMDDVATFQEGAIIDFKMKVPVGKTVAVQTSSAQSFDDGNNLITKFWVCGGEDFRLIAAGTFWIFVPGKGNWDKVGQDDLVRFQPRNSIIANGCQPETFGALYLRADFARLWDKVKNDAISDASWLSDFGSKGFFSAGDGSTTFRVPDMRGQFWRGLDLGRTLRLGNLSDIPGSYEQDAFKAHNHTLPGIPLQVNDTDRGGGSSKFSVDNIDNTKTTGTIGDSETRPKNIGLIPIIYY